MRLIGERMLEARKKFKVHPSRSLEIDYRHRMKDSVKQIVHVMLGGDLTEPSLNFKDSDLPPVDYLFYSVNPSDLLTISIAAIVVGPFSNPDMYRRRRHDWLMKAFALSWIYDRVILLLPHREALHSYREWIQRFSTRAAGRFAARDPSSVALANCRPSVEVVALPNKGHTRPSD